MSNNPYQNNPASGSTDAFGRPKQGGGALKWVMITLGGVLLITLCCCGGIAGLGYFGFNAGMGMVASGVKSQFNDHPDVQRELGGLTTLTVNLIRTGEIGQEGAGPNTMVFDAVGPNGSGEIHARMAQGQTNPDGSPRVEWAELHVNGTVYPLTDDADEMLAPEPVDGFDADMTTETPDGTTELQPVE